LRIDVVCKHCRGALRLRNLQKTKSKNPAEAGFFKK